MLGFGHANLREAKNFKGQKANARFWGRSVTAVETKG